jgi:hypothetical protein
VSLNNNSWFTKYNLNLPYKPLTKIHFPHSSAYFIQNFYTKYLKAWGMRGMHVGFWWESQKGRDYIGGRTILK